VVMGNGVTPPIISLLSVAVQTNSGTTILVKGVPGSTYTLQRTTHLLPTGTIWTNLASATASAEGANSGSVLFSDTNAPSTSFYRVRQP
jgi:hypothetical protein